MTETLTSILPDDLEDAVLSMLRAACDSELRLATAESCTGGLLASLLTDVPGCSHAFERGFVVYTEDAKREILDVPADVLATHGAVSEPVARALAEGALAHSKADISLGVTGFAGRGRDGDESGLVHFAAARRGRPTVHRVEHFGDVGRGAVRLESVRVAIAMMREMIA